MATPCSPSDHCGHARGSAGPYMYREAPQLAPSGQLRMARAPVQRQDLSLSHGLLCLILCFLMSLDTLSVRSDLTLGGQTLGLLCHSCFLYLFRHLLCAPLLVSIQPSRPPTVIPTACGGKRAPVALGLCCGCKDTLQSVCITLLVLCHHLPLFH